MSDRDPVDSLDFQRPFSNCTLPLAFLQGRCRLAGPSTATRLWFRRVPSRHLHLKPQRTLLVVLGPRPLVWLLLLLLLILFPCLPTAFSFALPWEQWYGESVPSEPGTQVCTQAPRNAGDTSRQRLRLDCPLPLGGAVEPKTQIRREAL